MSKESFDELLSHIKGVISYQNTNMRLSIPPEERVRVTLKYLATGISFSALSYEYLLAPSTLRKIVFDTCQVIWNKLQPLYMSETLAEDDCLRIADQFFARTKFPNIIGVVDGKHIRVIKPSHSGSNFFNYKKYFSVVLMA
nr:unnamed protein product [Callosobruchus analis]